MRLVRSHAAPVQDAIRHHWPRFAAIAALVLAADLLAKDVAVRALGLTSHVLLTDRLSLFVVYNTGSAGSLSVGPYTWQLNVLVTLLAVGMIAAVVTPMALVDGRATRALACITGGALGNLASLLWGPEGVADFVAIRVYGDTTVVANLADFALWGGAVMLAPVALLLLRLTRIERVSAKRAASRIGMLARPRAY
jgi:lipoprotein signal peptidase